MTRGQDTPLVQTYARIGGVLGLVSVAAGGFGEAYVPTMVISANDAAATATNIVQNSVLVRLGFASYLLEALCDVALALILYALLRPVHRDLALLATFFRLIGTTGFAVAQVFHFAALPLAQRPANLAGLSSEQLDALALLSIKTGQYGATVFMMFYGMGFLITGWLMLGANYLPRFVGILMMMTGAGFVARTFLWALAPAYASPLLLLPAAFAGLALGFWLILKGVDVEKWREQVAAGQFRSL
ncbi:MAG TPA: DUF4386 domain-containing protein [Allosphingosinicella sp.]|jgi:hypothetical protein